MAHAIPHQSLVLDHFSTHISQQFGCQLIVEMLQPDGDPHWNSESIWKCQEKALCAFSDSTSKVEVRKVKKANNLLGGITLTYELPSV